MSGAASTPTLFSEVLCSVRTALYRPEIVRPREGRDGDASWSFREGGAECAPGLLTEVPSIPCACASQKLRSLDTPRSRSPTHCSAAPSGRAASIAASSVSAVPAKLPNLLCAGHTDVARSDGTRGAPAGDGVRPTKCELRDIRGTALICGNAGTKALGSPPLLCTKMSSTFFSPSHANSLLKLKTTADTSTSEGKRSSSSG
mmetsp:Transcript_5042/g.13956  ORF Transcript_5042/g.13956 Transcript_5042/m.13956 type:complete len:202 (+) Transcript_5042:222-827(+)